METKQNIAYFSIPDFYSLYGLNMNLLTLMRDAPELFRDNVKVQSVYGSFPGCIWNGGEPKFGEQADDANIINTAIAFNRMGVFITLDLTNDNLSSDHIYDFYTNRILKLTESTQIANRVLINDFGLISHIKNNYQTYKMIFPGTGYQPEWRTTPNINIATEHKRVILPIDMNNTDVIYSLERPEKIEIIVNSSCVDGCKFERKCKEEINKTQLLTNSEFTCPHDCMNQSFYQKYGKRDHHVTPELIDTEYLPRGICHFQISKLGDSPINVIENYCIYLVKPEHRDNVRNLLLHTL